jgi:SAM-dependent methyltransferase
MDFQQAAIESLQTQHHIPVVCTDIEGLPRAYPAQLFDLITAFYVLEHVPDVDLLLANCYRLLRPGGWLVCAVPMVDSLQARVLRGHWVAITEAPRHLSLPTTSALRQLWERKGFVDFALRSDSILASAAHVGLSLFPGGATTQVYGTGKLRALVSRALAALVALFAIPGCWLESYVWGRPAIALVYGRKPELHATATPE